MASVLLKRSFVNAPMRAQLRPRGRGLSSSYVTVDKHPIHIVREGHGPHPLLLLPGALGSATTDFSPQLAGLDKARFTLIGWDPPGYGASRPPERNFDNFFAADAELAVKLMLTLGINRFSLLGWSDGGMTALIAAARSPEHVDKIVVMGANAFVSHQDMVMVNKVADVSAWSEKMRKPMEDIYGPEGFLKIWGAWCQAYRQIYEAGGDICCSDLAKIACPTLIIYGAKDAMVDPQHVHHLRKNIKGAISHTFPDGKHNLHFKYAASLNKMIEDFLCQPV